MLTLDAPHKHTQHKFHYEKRRHFTHHQNSFQGDNSIKQLVKRGHVIEAYQRLQKMNICDVYSWTAVLSGYVNIGKAEESLVFFCQMLRESIVPNNVAFICTLKACVLTLSLDWGRMIHAFIMHVKLDFDVYVGSCLVDMYVKCGSIQDATQVFCRLSVRNVVTWSTLIAGYVKEGLGAAALKLFSQMQEEKVAPNEVTFASNLSACCLIPSLEKGKEMYHKAVCCGFEADHVVKNKLIGMHMKCGCIDGARHVFDGSNKLDLVAWNTMVDGYTQHGRDREAVQLFQQMIEQGVKPDKSTFLSCLKACAQLQDIERGKHVYACIRKSSIEIDTVLGSSLVNMFAKCGSIENAYSVFNTLQKKRDVIAWTTMILALFQHGDVKEAFKLFEEMRRARVLPDKFTYNCVIHFCARMSNFDEGKRLHADIMSTDLELDVAIGSSLVGMYANCGDMDKAQEVFDGLTEKDIAAWNTMISCYAQHGDCKGLYSLFKKMHKVGLLLDKVTVTGILFACNHWGLVDEGYKVFGFIAIDPTCRMIAEHCSCFVDLLGRAGHLKVVEQFIGKMPFQPGSADWMSLLGACKLLYNADIAKDALGKLLEIEPQRATAYVLFSNTLDASDD
ncbi:hypothetical protein L7F22_035314 [Adiantum nelumboides]|nr:hypothetical protein [Adiantum nelumboides]